MNVLIVILVVIAIVVFALILSNYIAHSGGMDVIKNLSKSPASSFEKFIRSKFETITGHKFPTVLPDWLTYNGRVMELDGYSKELGLAFEAQGPQHTNYIKSIDNSYDDYLERIEKDEAKVKITKKNGVLLIVIDYKVPKYLMGLYIGSRLWDAIKDAEEYSKLNVDALRSRIGVWGFTDTKPMMYVEKIDHKPFTY